MKREPMMSCGVMRIQLKRATEFVFRFLRRRRPVIDGNEAQSGMCLCQTVVQGKCLAGGGRTFGIRTLEVKVAIVRQNYVGIGQTGVGGSVTGVKTDGLLKVFDCLQQASRSSLIPLVAPEQTQFINLRINRTRLCGFDLTLRIERAANLVCD